MRCGLGLVMIIWYNVNGMDMAWVIFIPYIQYTLSVHISMCIDYFLNLILLFIHFVYL